MTASISRIPGPPAGPSLRMTTTSPASMRPGGDRRHGVLLGLEHARRAAVVTALVAGELDHAAVGGEVAAQDGQAAGRLDRVIERAHDLLALGFLGGVGDFARGLAGHGDRVGVQEAGLLQALHDERDPAGLVEVGSDVLAAGLERAQQRRARADAVEVVDRELDPHLGRHREQVQDAVRRAAAHGDDGDGVLEALAGDDLARAQAPAQHVRARAGRRPPPHRSCADRRRAPWQSRPARCRAPRRPSPSCWR